MEGTGKGEWEREGANWEKGRGKRRSLLSVLICTMIQQECPQALECLGQKIRSALGTIVVHTFQ